jgi:hypothetical protein
MRRTIRIEGGTVTVTASVAADEPVTLRVGAGEAHFALAEMTEKQAERVCSALQDAIRHLRRAREGGR